MTITLRCDDCGQFARMEELEDREATLGGLRHIYGSGCWPSDAFRVINLLWSAEVFRGSHKECLDFIYELVGDSLAILLLEIQEVR